MEQKIQNKKEMVDVDFLRKNEFVKKKIAKKDLFPAVHTRACGHVSGRKNFTKVKIPVHFFGSENFLCGKKSGRYLKMGRKEKFKI